MKEPDKTPRKPSKLSLVPDPERRVIDAVFAAFLDRLRADESIDIMMVARLETLLASSTDLSPGALRVALVGDEILP
jgi:hypothetical protein